ncbi:alpha/beta hydrolase [Streptomyces sp. NPDC005438]|uniref:alpha/beta fold hydrolase n=1 Tax=Streptomyces sp. NPDC005438 TaxID=3156880 RepID=UPI0033A6F9A4
MTTGDRNTVEAVREVAASVDDGTGVATWARRAGIAGAAVGLVAASVAVDRLTVQRGMRRKARLALDAAGPYGTLRGTPGTVLADDGTELYYEVDEPTASPTEDDGDEAVEAPVPGDGAGGPTVPKVRLREAVRVPRRRLLGLLPSRSGEPPPTVVFCHGYCLNQDSWHFQRAAFRGAIRTVFWDQRGHGRSGRGVPGKPVHFDQLGRDLKAVLDAAVPEGPVVLVGHSMGGMTVMALAAQYPELVTERVRGVALLATSAGDLGNLSYGLPAAGARAAQRLLPGMLRAMAAQSDLVERGRRATADLFAHVVRRYSFGGGAEVDPGVARFAERLLESVPIDVVADFYPGFVTHERAEALARFADRPSVVLCGDRDLVTPLEHSERIASALPGAELVVAEGAGHLLLLEQPGLVNDQLARLLERTLPPRRKATRRR